MSYTDDDYLPSPAELDVPQEINLTSAPLRAASFQLGKWCDEQSKVLSLKNYIGFGSQHEINSKPEI